MVPRRNRGTLAGFGAVLGAAALLAVAACSQTADPFADVAGGAGGDDTGAPPAPAALARLGLMTSLPLYWPPDAALTDLAAGRARLPWQRQAMARRYALVPLDTLSPVAALSPGGAETDPLAGLRRLAVIQPRGLSPADNVALDGWVRAGGQLLLVLDPALTGDYDLPLGDPRRPVDSALIPPVAARWGLGVSYDADQRAAVSYARLKGAAGAGGDGAGAGGSLPLALPGRITLDRAATGCIVHVGAAMAVCRVGQGRVTLIADAAVFEHAGLAGADGAVLLAVLNAAVR